MKTKPPRRQKPKPKTFVFEFKTPSAGPILELAEDAAIETAIRKATTGGKP